MALYMMNTTTDTDVCPSGSEMDSKMILVIFYIILVIVGLIGNAGVITMIFHVIFNKGVVTNVYVYILFLSIVDFGYLSTGPLLITYMISGTWTFGDGLCRMNYVFEGLNKTMSVYLLVILSGDRFLAACRATTSSNYRSVKAAMAGLTAITILVAMTNIPIYMFTAVRPSCYVEGCLQCGLYFPFIWKNTAENFNENLSSIFHSNCSETDYQALVSPWIHWGGYYTLFLLIVYFILPASMISMFYLQIVARLRKQDRLVKKSSMRRNKVTKSVLAVVVFYFICWTPFWSLQCLILFFPNVHSSEEATETVVFLATCIYILPYVNSCLNPLLYAFLNKHLWNAYVAARKRNIRLNETSTSINCSTANLHNLTIVSQSNRTVILSSLGQTKVEADTLL